MERAVRQRGGRARRGANDDDDDGQQRSVRGGGAAFAALRRRRRGNGGRLRKRPVPPHVRIAPRRLHHHARLFSRGGIAHAPGVLSPAGSCCVVVCSCRAEARARGASSLSRFSFVCFCVFSFFSFFRFRLGLFVGFARLTTLFLSPVTSHTYGMGYVVCVCVWLQPRLLFHIHWNFLPNNDHDLIATRLLVVIKSIIVHHPRNAQVIVWTDDEARYVCLLLLILLLSLARI